MTDLAPAPYQVIEARENARLREENEELREALAIFTETPPKEWPLRRVFGLAAAESRVLRAMMVAGYLSDDAVVAVGCRQVGAIGSSVRCRNIIYRIRRCIRPHGLDISRVDHAGYRISPEHIATLKRMEADHG